MSNPLIAKLKAIADNIDPQVGGIAVLIIGDDIKLEFGVTSTGNAQFDAERLATAITEAVARRRVVREAPSLYPYRPTLNREGTHP